MVLLAVNCGLGNFDLASLPQKAVDLEKGWHTFGRPKTGMPRRCPLWPETVVALKDAIAARPKPAKPEDAGLCFLTRKTGQRWVRLRPIKHNPAEKAWQDSIRIEFERVVDPLGLHRKGHGFYALRHTHRTVADQVKDQPAAMVIMGHAPDANDMSAVYREDVSDERLLAVTNHIRA